MGDDTKSLNFAKSLMDDNELEWMVTNRMLERASVCLLGDDMIPKLKPHECVVFRDQFTAGLCMPCQDFVEEILKSYKMEMHHLTPNGIAKIALFIWAVKSQDVNLDIGFIILFCWLRRGMNQGRLLSDTHWPRRWEKCF